MASQSDLERFAAALRESDARDRAAKAAAKRAAAEARSAAEQAAAVADALGRAERDVAKAIEQVRAATASGRGRAEADQAWRAAKATLIELQTGAPPAWAPRPPAAAGGDVAEDSVVAPGDVEPHDD